MIPSCVSIFYETQPNCPLFCFFSAVDYMFQPSHCVICHNQLNKELRPQLQSLLIVTNFLIMPLDWW